MTLAGIDKQKFLNIGLLLSAWTFYGLFFASQSYVRQAYVGRNPDWSSLLSIWLTCGYSWAILTPGILFLTRRFPFTGKNWPWALAVHIPASLVFSVFALTLFSIFRALIGEAFSLERLQNLIVGEIHSSVLVYFAVLGVDFGIRYIFRTNSVDSFRIAAVNHNGDARALTNGGNGHLPAPFSEAVNTEESRVTSPVYPERFSVKEHGRIVLLDVGDVDLVTSEGNYVKLHTKQKSYLLRETMKAIEQKLDPGVYLRVRRSTIIRIDRIKELHPLFNGEFEIVLKSGMKISSSRRYKKNLDSLLKG